MRMGNRLGNNGTSMAETSAPAIFEPDLDQVSVQDRDSFRGDDAYMGGTPAAGAQLRQKRRLLEADDNCSIDGASMASGARPTHSVGQHSRS